MITSYFCIFAQKSILRRKNWRMFRKAWLITLNVQTYCYSIELQPTKWLSAQIFRYRHIWLPIDYINLRQSNRISFNNCNLLRLKYAITIINFYEMDFSMSLIKCKIKSLDWCYMHELIVIYWQFISFFFFMNLWFAESFIHVQNLHVFLVC